MTIEAPDIDQLATYARTLLAKVLVTPPTVEVREQDFLIDQTEHEMAGDKYLVIDGGSFTIVPIKAKAQGIIEVETVHWEVTIMDPEGDVGEAHVHGGNFDHALQAVALPWMLDQLSGHGQNMAEAEAMAEVERIQG